MKYPTEWTITWRDAGGYEIEGWYNGSQRLAYAFATEKMRELGAVTFDLERFERITDHRSERCRDGNHAACAGFAGSDPCQCSCH